MFCCRLIAEFMIFYIYIILDQHRSCASCPLPRLGSLSPFYTHVTKINDHQCQIYQYTVDLTVKSDNVSSKVNVFTIIRRLYSIRIAYFFFLEFDSGNVNSIRSLFFLFRIWFRKCEQKEYSRKLCSFWQAWEVSHWLYMNSCGSSVHTFKGLYNRLDMSFFICGTCLAARELLSVLVWKTFR